MSSINHANIIQLILTKGALSLIPKQNVFTNSFKGMAILTGTYAFCNLFPINSGPKTVIQSVINQNNFFFHF